MRGTRAKMLYKDVQSYVPVKNAGKYKIYKNRIAMVPVMDKDGNPALDPEGMPLLKPDYVEGTIVTANPRREMYKMAKKFYKLGHRHGIHDHQRPHKNHKRRYINV